MQLSDAAVAAAVQVANAAGSIGGKSAEDIKRISDTALDAALQVASAGEQLRNGLTAIDSPWSIRSWRCPARWLMRHER